MTYLLCGSPNAYNTTLLHTLFYCLHGQLPFQIFGPLHICLIMELEHVAL